MRRADRPQRAAAARYVTYTRKIAAEARLELIVARGMDLYADALQQVIVGNLPDGAGPLERADALNHVDLAGRAWREFLRYGLLPLIGALFRDAFDEQRALLPTAAVTAAGEPDDDFDRAFQEELAKLDDVFDGDGAAEYRAEAEALFGEEFNAERKSADHSAYRYEQQHIADVHDRLVIWPDGAWEQMRPEIEEAIAEGESINDVRDRIAHIIGTDSETRRIRAEIGDIDNQLLQTDLTADERAALQARRRALWGEHDASTEDWEYNARRVARTEVQGAVESGHDAAAKAAEAETGVELYKRWLSTPDDRTRWSHRVSDGQIVKLSEKFTVGKAHLDHPADPNAMAPSESINCRCTATYHTKADVDQELLSEDGSIGAVRPGGVRLGPDDETAVQAAIDEEKAAQKEWDAEHGSGMSAGGHVRDTDYWDMPEGTPITRGMKPQRDHRRREPTAGPGEFPGQPPNGAPVGSEDVARAYRDRRRITATAQPHAEYSRKRGRVVTAAEAKKHAADRTDPLAQAEGDETVARACAALVLLGIDARTVPQLEPVLREKGLSTPDLILMPDGTLVEVKGVTSPDPEALSANIREGRKQARAVLVDATATAHTEEVAERELRRVVENPAVGPHLDEATIVLPGGRAVYWSRD